MNYTEYASAEAFLARTQAILERREAANALLLGIALRLVAEPNAYGGPPYLGTVESPAGLQLAALMTPPFNLQLYMPDDGEPGAMQAVADALLRGRWPVSGVLAQEHLAGAFAALWSSLTGLRGRTAMRQRVYELRRVLPPPTPPGLLRQASVDDIEQVRHWASGFHDECYGDERREQSMRGAEARVRTGDLFLWVDGVPVSMAARARPTPHGQAVGLVYTPLDRRRKGYATALVAGLSQTILDGGKQFCTLFADLSNPTSNHIYRSIGYEPIADVVEVRFEAGP